MTPSLLLFFTMCMLVCVVLAWVVIYPWMFGGRVKDNRLMAVNVAVFKQRIAELQADKQAGVIDEMVFASQELELKRQLLDAQMQTHTYAPVGIKSRLIVMVWVPLLACLAYLTFADRTAVFGLWHAQDTVGQVAEELLVGKIDTPPEWAAKQSTALISAMQTNVHYHANDPNRWMRLSELFLALQATPQALEALARAYRLDPSNTQIAITYAQTSFFANNGVLDATTKEVLTTLLQHSPNHEGALMLLAMGESRAGNFEQAKALIGKLRSNIAQKSGDRSEALASLDKLLETIRVQQQKATASVEITIDIADALLVNLSAQDVLFVTITDSKGGAPYAVKRLSANDIKQGRVGVSLSDLDAMLPTHTLSVGRHSGQDLLVNARISHTGNAIAQSGDWSAIPVVLKDTQTSVHLTISQITP